MQITDSDLFDLGQVVATTQVATVFGIHESGRMLLLHFLEEHVAGRYGVLEEEDRNANDDAIMFGGRILSAYPFFDDEHADWTEELVRLAGPFAPAVADRRVYVITEEDRSVTTIMFPSEY